MGAVAHISLAACAANCRTLRKAAGARRLFAVVKADAYGHGMLPVARAIAGYVDGLCVFAAADGQALREAKIECPILVMGGVRSADEAVLLGRCRLWPAVSQLRDVELLEGAGAVLQRVFIKVQTGMHRLGFVPREAVQARARIAGAHPSAAIALMHHYACAEQPCGTKAQDAVMAGLAGELGLPFTASNSAATLLQAPSAEEFVRCGIGVYGAAPGGAGRSAASLGLQPAMQLQSTVLAVQDVVRGQAVGYGARWSAPRDTRVAIVDCGYAHGYPRAAAGASVWINGQRAPLAGAVSMEMLAVQATSLQVVVGDEVELWGGRVPVDEVAEASGTIGYELLASLPACVPRSYLDVQP